MATDALGRTTPNAPVSGWTVLSQQQVYDVGPDGRAVLGMRVTFKLYGSDSTASVFIPMTEYTANNVRAHIADLAGHLAQVDKAQG